MTMEIIQSCESKTLGSTDILNAHTGTLGVDGLRR